MTIKKYYVRLFAVQLLTLVSTAQVQRPSSDIDRNTYYQLPNRQPLPVTDLQKLIPHRLEDEREQEQHARVVYTFMRDFCQSQHENGNLLTVGHGPICHALRTFLATY